MRQRAGAAAAYAAELKQRQTAAPLPPKTFPRSAGQIEEDEREEQDTHKLGPQPRMIYGKTSSPAPHKGHMQDEPDSAWTRPDLQDPGTPPPLPVLSKKGD